MRPIILAAVFVIVGCSRCDPGRPGVPAYLNRAVVAHYGETSRLMQGDDATSQSIINRYCLAESKDRDDHEPIPNDPYKSGWRPWFQHPLPQTYDLEQNVNGTYRLRYKAWNLDASGMPLDTWPPADDQARDE
jgi:hypothetical protein